MKKYDHSKIESKWQKIWEKDEIYKAESPSTKAKPATGRLGRKFYVLIEFPYASGEGLHVGHVRSYTALDIVARKKRMEGFNVLYPIGWDAFGLPTENYAIKTGINPKIITKKNTDNFRKQLKALGFSFDWSREINTSSPEYYRWTQWIFLQFFKHGLAYKKKMPINWCLSCKIGLANEEVVNGVCERCGGQVEKREKEQWMLAITKYADRLYDDLDKTEFLEKIKIQQRNWIGKSHGTEIDFKIENSDKIISVFTTRVDTIFSGTFLVIAPEHDLVEKITKEEYREKVFEYRKNASKISQIDRMSEEREKTGVFTGSYAINPATDEKMPIWIADFVLVDYGTGVVFADAHDERDFEMAKKFGIPLKVSLRPNDDKLWEEVKNLRKCFTEEGTLINSAQFDGMSSAEARPKITEWLGGKGVARFKTTYKLRDWIFSRQRYWGEPIPLVFCEKCAWVPIPEDQLPVELPDVKKYEPTDSGESPLASLEKWVNVKCPKCGGSAKRETDTMPNWAGSSWYWLRYTDPKNDKVFADKKKLKYWTPVDWYNGGMEHTTLHLLYSRFWHKFLFDIGLVPTDEPYVKRTSHGMILGDGGEKMSKSRGNVINPDDIIERFGADSFRLYEMFLGPFDQQTSWNSDGVVGTRRFIEKVWGLSEKINEKGDANKEIDNFLNKTIKKVGEDIENIKFNTAVSSMMVFLNFVYDKNTISKDSYKKFLKILSPFAPHITEELWQEIGEKKSVHFEAWPSIGEIFEDENVNIIVQINGKMRASFEIKNFSTEEEIKEKAVSLESVSKWIDGEKIKKIIYIKGKLVNIVTI